MLNHGDEPGPGAEVTAENWHLPPHNRWAYWHVRDILPTHRIAPAAHPRDLPPAAGAVDIDGVGLVRLDGSEATVGEVLADTYTDAIVVLQDGAVVAERYGAEGSPTRTHALMSVTKSVVGCVAAALVDRKVLDTGRLVTDVIPELAASGYAGATVRDVLDMRSGVRFGEDYTNPDADVWRLFDSPTGVYGYLAGLEAEAPHGSRFRYRSAETDVLGWVCERVAGQPMAELITTLIWQPMGAESDAEIMCDVTDVAVHDGGLCATARDVARFGQMLLDGGTVPMGGGVSTVVGSRWLRDSWAVNADIRSVFAASPNESSMRGGWYHNQFWFRPGAFGDVLLCLGIHGQMVHVSRRTRTVCVKLSTWPEPQRPDFLQDTLRAFDNLGGALSGRYSDGERHRLPGIVSGVSRHGATDRSGEHRAD